MFFRPVVWPLLCAFSHVLSSPIESQDFNALWYDAGLYGAFIGQRFVSFPLVPPQVSFLNDDACDSSYTFLSPRGRSVPKPGPIILDAQGELIWMEDKYGQAMDFRVQRFRDQDYLTFWRGSDSGTHGTGTYLMLNETYDVVYEVQAAGGKEGDLHEFNIIGDRGLISIYDIIPADLSSVGGPVDGYIYDGLFQEINIDTGELIYQWRASEHYKVSESFAPLQGKGKSEEDAWDYFHINSVDKDEDGNYYISSRYMHTITSIAPDGEIRWILGGKRNEFKDLSDGAATNFTWQHHMRWFPGNIVTIFDNGAYDTKIETAEYSRGLRVALNLEEKTATLLQDYVNPAGVLAHSQGSVQILPSGNVFVGWGHVAGYSEFKPDGTPVCDVHFGSYAFYGSGWVKSYRDFKGTWVGKPKTSPSIALKNQRRKTTVYASWNGATEVSAWRLEQAELPGNSNNFKVVENLPKDGFETAFDVVGGVAGYFRVAALDATGQVLGYSEAVDRKTGRTALSQAIPFQDIDLLPLQFLMATCLGLTVVIAAWRFFSSCTTRRMKM